MVAKKISPDKKSKRSRKKEAAVAVVEVNEDLDPDEQLALLSRRSEVDSETSKELNKKNKIYQHIKREIDQKEKNKPTDVPVSDQVYFVDKQRNAAVVIGEKDLKKDVNNKKRKDRAREEDESEESDGSILVTQAIHELKCGSADVALTFLNSAIMLDLEDISPFIIRSQCYLRMGRTSEALEDADKAMDMDRNNPRALIAKGEALYATGNFEVALVNFERGGKLRQSQDIKDGMKKCKEAILLTLGKYAKFDEKIVRRVLAEPIKEREKTKKKSSRGKSKSKSMAEVVREMNREKRKDKNLLGMSRLYES